MMILSAPVHPIWLAHQQRWTAIYEQRLSERLRWAIAYVQQQTPPQVRDHFDSLLALLRATHARSALHPIALELIAALHPWPVRWGQWEAWEQQLRFAITSAEQRHLPEFHLKFLAELAAMLSASAHQYDARLLSEQALTLARRQHAVQPWAVAGAAQLAAILKRGEIDRAITLLAQLDLDWPELAAAASEADRVNARALIDFQRIDLLTRRGEPTALAACRDLIAALKSQPTVELELLAEAYSTLGISLYRYEEYPPALEALERAIELRAQTHDPVQEVHERMNIGLVALSGGALEKSADALEQGAALAERLNLRRWVYTTLSTLSGVYLAQGRLDTARDRVNRAVRLAEEAGDPIEIARAINNRAAIWLHRGQFDNAWRDFHTFQSQFYAQARLAVQLGLCLNLALGYFRLGEITKAEESVRRALELGRPAKRGLELLADRLLALWRPRAESEVLLRQALLIARQIHRRLDEAACLLSLSAVVESESERTAMWQAGTHLLKQCGASAWLTGCSPDNPPFVPMIF